MPFKKYVFLLPISYMSVIYVTSSIPGDADYLNNRFVLKFLTPALQNLLHIPVFGIMAILWIVTFRRLAYKNSVGTGLSAAISVGYGMLDEVHQYFVPGRYMSLSDIFLNIVGVFSAVGICRVVSSYK